MGMSDTIHIARPASKGGNPSSDTPVAWCGRTTRLGEDVTIFSHRGTCERCKELDKVFREDREYEGTQRKLATLRQIAERLAATG